MLRIERQDYPSPCDHPNPNRCHAKGPDRYGHYWHDIRSWHVWDTDRGDYAAGTGPHQFTRYGDAVTFIHTKGI